MKYQAPYGVADPNSSYINGNPATGIQGSIPPALAFEEPMRELVALIIAAGFTPSDIDLAQVARAVRQGLNFVVATMIGGNPNSLQGTSVIPLDQYRGGLELRVLIPATNTGATAINIDSVGFVNIIRGNGAALSAGDLPAGMVAVLVFDGASFQIQNFQGFTSSTTNNNVFNVSLPYIADSGTTNHIVATFSPAITGTIVAGGNGGEILVKLGHTVTGATDIMINGLGPFSVKRPDGTPLQNGDCPINQVLWMLFDGASYQVSNIQPASPFSDLIDAPITRTVHGGGAFYTDLAAAFEDLSKFKITNNGMVTLQLAAGQFFYSSMVFATHPNLERIIIKGATMLAPVGTTDAPYARNGSFNRIADNATNLAYLRTKFATELRFTGGVGLTLKGNLGGLDAILFTGDGTQGPFGWLGIGSGGSGLFWIGLAPGAGITFLGGDFCTPNLPSQLGLTSGIAVHGFGAQGITANMGGSGVFPTNGPVISIGNSLDGIGAYNGGKLVFTGSVLCFGNGFSGAQADSNGYVKFMGNVWTECNFAYGIAAYLFSVVEHQGTTFFTFNNGFANVSPALQQVGNVNSMVF